MDALPPGLLEGGGVVGLFILLFWMLSTGRLVTRREADAITKRAENAEAANASLIAQNHELIEISRLGQHVFTALRQGAEQ